MPYKYISFLLFSFALLLPTTKAFSQADEVLVYGTVKNERSGKKMDGVQVALIEDGKQVNTFSTPINGRFEFFMQYNHSYDIKFIKDGYVTKFITIDTRNVPVDDKVGGQGFDLDMSLFETVEGVNFDILKQPIGIAKYSPTAHGIAFDYDYTKSIQDKIAKLKRDLEEKYKEEEDKLREEQLAAKKEQEKQEKFDKLIKEGDDQMAVGAYANAVFKYSDALDVMPDVKYVQDKLAQAKKAMEAEQAKKALESKYNEALAAADKQFNAKNYKEAVAGYNEALKLKPDEGYPKEKIKEAEVIIAQLDKQKAIDKQYADLIAKADTDFKADKLDNALIAYNQASELKANEQYPKDQIALINKKLDEKRKKEALDADYTAALKAGDEAFKNQQYAEAIKGYTKASELKPAETYPKSQIDEANKKIAEQKKLADLEKQYADAVAEGDKAFKSEKWQDAITAFNQAKSLKPQEAYPPAQIALAQGKLDAIAAAKAKDENYNTLIAGADDLFKAKKWNEAINQYNAAAKVKPSENYPKTQIAAANKELDAIAKQNELEAKYKELITAADSYFNAGSYQEAIKNYTEASTTKPGESYPKDKIKEANDKLGELAAAKALEENYKKAIAAADAKFSANQFEDAIKGYQDALKLKAGEKYPQDQIAAANAKLGDIEKAKALDKQYQDKVADADANFGKEKWTEALGLYKEATALKANEAYPKEQAAKAQAKLDALAQQKELEANYTKTIATADGLLKSEKWKDAIASYEKASALKPNEQYPKDKIAEANKALDAIAATNAKEEQYKSLIASADDQFKANDWKGAIDAYNQALAIKPKETYPKDQIKAANDKIAAAQAEKQKEEKYLSLIAMGDAAFTSADYEASIAAYNKALEAKPGEKYPTDQIALARQKIAELDKAEAIQKQYDDAIAAADADFGKSKWTEALANYKKANGLKPNEAYPKSKIKDVETKLNDLAEEAAKNKAYNDKLTAADDLYEKEQWQPAIDAYLEAAKMKPAETYPKNQAEKAQAKLDALAKQAELANQYKTAVANGDAAFGKKEWQNAISEYNKALALQPKEAYPKEQIDKANKAIEEANKQKALDAEYNTLIAAADTKFEAKNYKEAIKGYENASKVKPTENYPKEQIIAANQALDNLEKQAELDAKFQNLVAQADKAFTGEKWESAIDLFNQALAVKANAPYPKQKITEAQAKLDAIAAAKAKEDNYNQFITSADQSFKNGTWSDAIANYKKALEIKPNEAYPPKQIAAAQAKLDEIAAKKAAADQYRDIIASADESLSNGKYNAAIDNYKKALGVKPGDSYAEAQIKVAQEFIAKEEAAKLKEQKFNSLIASADGKFNNKQYNEAIADYNEALTLKANDAHATSQIAKAKEALAAQAEQNKLNAQYDAIIKAADGLFGEAKHKESIDKYKQALIVKAGEAYPQQKITEAQAKLDELERIRKEKQAEYDGYISKADLAFKSEAYTTAISYYKRATSVLPKEKYPRDQIALAEEKLSAIAQAEAKAEAESLVSNTVVPTLTPEEEEANRRTETFTDVTTLGEIKRQNAEKEQTIEPKPEEKPKPKVAIQLTASDDVDKFRRELGKNYPEGLTEENHKVENKDIYRLIWVENKMGDEYLRVSAKFGTFYFKNGEILESSQYQAEVAKFKP